MDTQDFGNTASNFASEFFHLFQGLTYVPYIETPLEEALTGQYFVISVVQFLGDDDESMESSIQVDLLYFSRSDIRDDNLPDPNRFFKVSDELFTELFSLSSRGKLKTLSGLLPETNRIIFQIESRFASEDLFIRNLLEEQIAIFYCSEDELSVDCMLNERKRVQIVVADRTTFLTIPFDKVKMFRTVADIEGGTSNTPN